MPQPNPLAVIEPHPHEVRHEGIAQRVGNRQCDGGRARGVGTDTLDGERMEMNGHSIRLEVVERLEAIKALVQGLAGRGTEMRCLRGVA